MMTEQKYYEHIESLIKEIESIDSKNSWSYEQVLHSILKINSLPIIRFHEPKGNYLFRSRINNGTDFYTNISEISMPDEKFVSSYARANKPKQALFYGSQNRPTSYLEFALHLAKTTPFRNEVYITVGRWELKRDLTFTLVFNPNLPRNNDYNKLHGEYFDDFIARIPKQLRKGTIRFFAFIAEKYAEQSNDNITNYLITCAYSNIVFAHGRSDGIIYPSVPRGGDAFNVVLKKNVISEGALELNVARTDCFVARERDNGKHDFVNIKSTDSSRIEDGKIEWNNDWEQYT